MKKSKAIPMMMLGCSVLVLAGCDPTPGYGANDMRQAVEARQNAYSSRADCEKDWGKENSKECQVNKGGGYAGPRYFYNHGSSTPMILDNNGNARAAPSAYLGRPGYVSTSRATTSHSASISRGGFGSTARGFSSGG